MRSISTDCNSSWYLWPEPLACFLVVDLPMSSAENGYCSSDSLRAESPRSRRRRRTRSRLAPGPSVSATSATSPPRCRRRCWQLSAGPDGIHHLACLMCASLLHMGRERAEANRIWEARAPETCQIRSVAAIPRTAATGSGVSQLPWPPPRLSSPPPRRFARLSSSAAITLQGERHARQVRGSPDGCEKERK